MERKRVEGNESVGARVPPVSSVVMQTTVCVIDNALRKVGSGGS